MALSLNQVQIIGNVGADPDVRSFQNGGKVANLSVATSRRWKDRGTGELREETEWHRINVTADHLVGVVEERVRKGTPVFLSGRLRTRKWQDQSGQDRYTTEIVVAPYGGELIVFGPRSEAGAGRAEAGSGSTGQAGPQGGPGEIDDEIPF